MSAYLEQSEFTMGFDGDLTFLGLLTKIGPLILGGYIIGNYLANCINNWKKPLGAHVIKDSQSFATSEAMLDKLKETVEEVERRRKEKEERLYRKRHRQEMPTRQSKRPRIKYSFRFCRFICIFAYGYNRSKTSTSDPAEETRGNPGSQTDRKLEELQRELTNQRDGQNEQSGGDQERDDEDEESSEEEGGEEEEEEEEEEETEEGKKRKKLEKIKIGLQNVLSMNKKVTAVLHIIVHKELDVFLTTETWLKPSTVNGLLTQASPANFNSHHRVRRCKRGGGVATQFSEKLQSLKLRGDNITAFEHVTSLLKLWLEPILIINVYRPPKESLPAFFDQFRRLMDYFSGYDSVIVAGDFNIRVDTNMSMVRKFTAILGDLGLEQHVRGPTHKKNHTLDLVMSRGIEITDLNVDRNGLSDHYGIFFKARPTPKKETKKKRKNVKKSRRRMTSRSD